SPGFAFESRTHPLEHRDPVDRRSALDGLAAFQERAVIQVPPASFGQMDHPRSQARGQVRSDEQVAKKVFVFYGPCLGILWVIEKERTHGRSARLMGGAHGLGDSRPQAL